MNKLNVFDFLPGSRKFPLAVHQFSCWVNKKKYSGKWGRLIRFGLMIFYYIGTYLSVVTRKVQIDERVKLGENICLAPQGGIIIGAEELGDNCTVGRCVTIGWGVGSGREVEVPVIGKNVLVEANSIIYGKIQVGDGVVIKEGTVLSKSVPDRCVVQGVPGRIIARNQDNEDLLRLFRTGETV